jgi:hypothetical protein
MFVTSSFYTLLDNSLSTLKATAERSPYRRGRLYAQESMYRRGRLYAQESMYRRDAYTPRLVAAQSTVNES